MRVVAERGILFRSLKDCLLSNVFFCSDTLRSWILLRASKGPNVTALEPMTCGSNVCPPAFTGKFCETEIGKLYHFTSLLDSFICYFYILEEYLPSGRDKLYWKMTEECHFDLRNNDLRFSDNFLKAIVVYLRAT